MFCVGPCFPWGVFALTLQIPIGGAASPCRQLSLFLPCCLPTCCRCSNSCSCTAVLCCTSLETSSGRGLCRVAAAQLVLTGRDWPSGEGRTLLHSLKTLLVCILERWAFVPLGSMWQLGIMGKEGGDVQGFNSPLLPIHCAVPVVS